MSSFSQRMGYNPTRSLVQQEDLDAETRVAMWNLLVIFREILEDRIYLQYQNDGYLQQVLLAMWTYTFKEARDEYPGDAKVWQRMKAGVLDFSWFDALDVLEISPRTSNVFSRSLSLISSGRVSRRPLTTGLSSTWSATGSSRQKSPQLVLPRSPKPYRKRLTPSVA